MKKCPLCGDPLVQQSDEDAGYDEPDWYCQKKINHPGDKTRNHYREYVSLGLTVMFVDNYRISNSCGQSKVGVHSRYKSCRGKKGAGKYYFKTLIKCPEIHPDTEQKLKDRIKLLILVS